MNALERLRAALKPAVSQPLSREWHVANDIDRELSRLERHVKDGPSPYVPKNQQEEALKRFWNTMKTQSFSDAHLASFGVALPIGPRRLTVIEDRERLPALLDCVDEYLSSPRHYRRCYQGLLSGYFTYDGEHRDTPTVGRDNWRSLRSYLSKRVKKIRTNDINPQWVDTLEKHNTIFSEDPCGRYGPAMLAGDEREVKELREVLNIQDASWFMRKLFLAQIQAATKKRDSEYLLLLGNLLKLLAMNQDVRDEGLTMVLDRHVSINPAPMSVPLRDAAVTWWGNPWLSSNSMRWGSVRPEARKLVTDWLKLELLETFFVVLTEEGHNDNRRLNFWRKYIDSIDSMHFALGLAARENRSRDFIDLKRKMEGLTAELHDNNRNNNAFIMNMGKVVVVEFGAYSNACYGYSTAKPLPFDLTRPLTTPVNDLNSLKHREHKLRWKHQDGIHGWEKWEDMFEASLGQHFDIRPGSVQRVPTTRRVVSTQDQRYVAATAGSAVESARPNSASADWRGKPYTRSVLYEFATRFQLKLEDLSRQNGNLWVRTDDAEAEINAVLKHWGFSYKPGKGWWKY